MKRFRFEDFGHCVQDMYRVRVEVRTRLGLRLGIGIRFKVIV